MSQPIRVGHDTLHASAGEVRSARSEVDGLLGKIKGVVVGDLGPAWKGQAAGAFQKLMEQWDIEAKDLLKALSDIADLLDKSGTKHQVNDEEQGQQMNKILGALSPHRAG
ncbi:WXG100 family type VII secretion target [Longispora albida]|uniref:WXG100 family type VII secretion target n=1 Tax=Longispora albida TaxID=203523 RepID=UPI000360C5A7|nr:WXG100 family type VII secretion target [Longispora albida]